MPKLHKSDNWFTTEENEEGQLVNIIVASEDGSEPEVIQSQNNADIADAKSALYAASDYLRHGCYDHQETKVGLHIRPDTVLNSWRGTNLAIVSIDYEDDGLGIPTPSEHEFPEGWAQLNRRNKRWYLTHFSSAECETRCRKHDFVDAYLEGRGFNIRVLPFNSNKDEKGMGAADYVLLSWLEDDDKKAADIRLDGISRAESRRRINRGVSSLVRQGVSNNAPEGEDHENGNGNGNGRARTGSDIKSGKYGNIYSGAIMVVKYGSGERFDITEVPHQSLTVINNRRQSIPLEWNGTTYSRARLVEVAELGYPVKVNQ